MAMIKCRECGADVSSQAKACPKCGSPPHGPVAKTSGARIIAMVFGALLLAPFLMRACEPSKPEPPPKSAAELAAERKRDAELTRAATYAVTLKHSMKDPQSFDLTSLMVQLDGSACFEYRATNSFGAHLQSQAVLTTDGKLLTRERDKNKFVKAWNAACLSPGGQELAPLMKQRGIG